MQPAPDSEVKPLASNLLSAVGLAPSADGDVPDVPGDSPLLLAGLAAFRRQTQQSLAGDEASALKAADPTQSSLVLAAAAGAPAVPTVGAPNQATGVVSGSLNGYTVAGQPSSGTLVVSGDTYTYTPTAAARLGAGLTTQPDFDSFAVTASGQPATTVTVPILPGVLSGQSPLPAPNQPVPTTPTGLAVNPTYAYVANQKTAGTVSVIDTATGAVVKTIAVGSQPSAVAINPATGLAYVTNRGSGTVSVIDTATNAVVGSAIRVGSSPQDAAVAQSATITRIYVVNNASNNVSAIDARNGNRVSTISLGLGNSAPTSVAVSADGTRAYVTHRTSTGGGRVSVINTATNTVIATVNVGTSPQDVAVAGTNVYVANNGSSSVSVINTAANNSVTTINVGTLPTSLAVSPDGSLVAVARDNDNVAVIETRTNTVIGTQYLLDTTSPDGGHVVAFSPDGRILVTDAADQTVRVVGLARGNTAPVSIADPTIDGTDTGSGAVTGSLNVKDWDGDTVTYTVTSQPTSTTVSVTPTGTVTVDAAGTYTYSPNQAARDLAAQTSGVDTTTFVVTANDGVGGTRAVTVAVPITPLALPPNQAPVATTPVFNSRNAATGVVTGSWKVTDADGNPLTYTVTAPTRGTVEITRQGDTYTYVYTPSQAERFAALNTAQADYDQFAVSVSDGRASTTVNVSVPVLPANIGDTAFVTYLPAGADPGGVTVVGDRAYVLNPGNNTVTILTSGQYPNVIATVPVSTTPTSMADNSQYHRAYIGGANAVTVINTDDNTKVTTMPTGGGQVYGIAVSPDGSKVYVTNTAAGTVSVINPVNNTVVGTIQVGSNPAGVTFTPDGRFAYVANMGTNTVTVINAATDTPLASPIVVGTNPANVAVSPDGKWAYVTNYASNTVSYIDTATNTVVGSPLSVAEKPYGIATSPDGSILYVASATGTAMYDATTRRWISTIWSGDNNARRTSAVYRNGLFIYTTNTTEDLLRTTSIIRGNTAPIASGAPTVGAPDPVLGAVSGSLNVEDPDGDWLTYRVSGPLPAGTVSFDGVGGYTFTPTQAARDAAAQTQGADYATFTITASDSSYPASQGSVDVTVTVPIAPSGASIPTTMTAINVGPSPGKVVISNGRAYVYNSSNRTVMVIDPATNKVTSTIPVPSANDFVVRNDGRVYVMGYDTVSVVNSDGTQAVPSIRIPDLCETEGCWGSSGGLTDIAINPTGTSVYVVRQYYIDTGTFSAVSMIDTSSNTVVNTVSTYPFSDIEVTPDGTRLYAAESDYRVVPVLSAINLGSAGGVAVSAPGEWPYVTNVSISPDGKRTYALVGGTAWAYDPPVSISAIDSDPTSSTYNTQIATIALPGAYDVAFSPDSRRAYVLMNDGKTVRVVDTATSSVVGYFTVPGANSIAVAPNGTVYLTHAAAGTVYAVTVGGATSPL